MWRPSVRFSPAAFFCSILRVPLLTRIAFILGTLVGRATHAYVFLKGFLLSLAEIHPSFEVVLVV